jgi:hypothetical protein
MATFKRKHKDPAQEVYRQMAREQAMKKKYDFIGMTGKMDVPIDGTDKYKRAEERFKNEITKPIEEDFYDSHWHPHDATDETLRIANSLEPEDVAKKVNYLKERILRDGHDSGHLINETYLPYSEKHKLATEMLHHEFRRKHPSDEDFHSSKTSIDKVLEEMTKNRPNAENRERIRNGIDTFKKSHPALHEYLKSKFSFATDEDPVGPFKAYEPHEQVLTPEEVDKYKDKYKFTHGRTIQEVNDYARDTNKRWQIHPDGSKTRVSSLLRHTLKQSDDEPSINPFTSEDDSDSVHFHHKNLKELHTEHLKNGYYQSAVHNYTNDSRDLNRYIAKGELGHNPESISKRFDAQSDAISSAMHNSPPYEHKLQVWTGLSASNDIGAYAAKKRGDKEKLVGHFPAFTSSSLDYKQATEFAKGKDAEGFEHQQVHDVARIDIPKAYHRGIYVDGVSEHPGEKEYILDKAHDMEFHPKPMYHAYEGRLLRVWKARPIIHQDDEDAIRERVKKAREF